MRRPELYSVGLCTGIETEVRGQRARFQTERYHLAPEALSQYTTMASP